MSYECAICQEKLNFAPPNPANTTGSNISATSCGHVFHTFCITQWMSGTEERNRECPYCRKAISASSTLQLFPTTCEDGILLEVKAFADAFKRLEAQLTTQEKTIEELRAAECKLEQDRAAEHSMLLEEKEVSSKLLIEIDNLKKRSNKDEIEMERLKKFEKELNITLKEKNILKKKEDELLNYIDKVKEENDRLKQINKNLILERAALESKIASINASYTWGKVKTARIKTASFESYPDDKYSTVFVKARK